jgi:hypothetical protein
MQETEPYDLKTFFLYLSGTAVVGLVIAAVVRVQDAAKSVLGPRMPTAPAYAYIPSLTDPQCLSRARTGLL